MAQPPVFGPRVDADHDLGGPGQPIVADPSTPLLAAYAAWEQGYAVGWSESGRMVLDEVIVGSEFARPPMIH
jgi:hypothetical protein